MHKKKQLIFVHIILMTVLLNLSAAYADDITIRHIRPMTDVDYRNEYFIEMLNLALKKTETTDGSFKLAITEKHMPQGRAIDYLRKQRELDVIWTMTSQQRERILLPVRIPLLKGLLGHRVCIINHSDQGKFATVTTVDDLKRFRVGQGHDWPDTDILRANGINVIGAEYTGLFRMLLKRRFDCFPRGVNEAWSEVEAHKQQGLIVEPRLLLHYPAPTYFFVNKGNQQLAERLERGLRLAINDGSFDELFMSHPMNQAIFRDAKLDTRVMLKLDNPLLPPETPLDEKILWYKP